MFRLDDVTYGIVYILYVFTIRFPLVLMLRSWNIQENPLDAVDGYVYCNIKWCYDVNGSG